MVCPSTEIAIAADPLWEFTVGCEFTSATLIGSPSPLRQIIAAIVLHGLRSNFD
jgi:hypothetical protein